MIDTTEVTQQDGRKKLPNGWRWVRLGEVCNLRKGRTPREEWYAESGCRLVRFRDLKNGRVDWTEGFRSFVSPQYAEFLQPLPGKVTLITSDAHDPASIGKKIAYVEVVPESRGAVYYSGEMIAVQATDESLIESSWPFLWLSSEAGYAEIQAHVDGVHLNSGPAREILIPLPPLSDQKRIAAILNELIAAVERAQAAAQAQLEAAKALLAAYLRLAFNCITPLSVSSERDSAPSGWRWRRLLSLAQLESGHTPSRYHPEWWGGAIPWLALPDIRGLDGKIAFETSEYTNEAGIANSSARVLPAGTVVLSRTASVGFVTVMGRPMATSQDFVNWICGPELDAYFLAFLLRASRRYIRSLSSGAIHQTVYVPTVKAFDVCIPSLPEQKRIVARLSEQMAAAERTRKALEEQLDTISKLPAALLRRAFSGGL